MVFLPPEFDRVLSILKSDKPVLIETFISNSAVEALDVGIIAWGAWPSVLNDAPSHLATLLKVAAPELRAVINPNPFRVTMKSPEALDELRYYLPGN